MNYIKQIETSTTIIALREDGIVESRATDGCPEISNVGIAQEIIAAVIELCNNEDRQMISFVSDRRLSKEERQYYSKNSFDIITDLALVVDNPYKRLLGNFFMGINKVPIRTKLFENEEEAIKWLKKNNLTN